MLTTRRALLRAGLLLGGAALLSACSQPPAAPPAAKPTEAPKPADKPAEAAKPADKPAEAAKPAESKPAAPAAAPAAPKASLQGITITYWNGLTGADGKIMDELIDRFTKDTGIKVEQQRIVWADLYAKLQVSTPAGEGPDLCLMHTGEIPHFADDGIVEAIDDKALADNGFKGEDYVESTWQGGLFNGKRYAVPLDVPQHVMYLHNQLFRDAGLAGSDGKAKPPTNKDELLSMAQTIAKGDTFGLAIGTLNLGIYVWGFHNLLWQNGANVFTPDFKKSALTEPAAIEAAELWGSLHPTLKVAPPGNANARDAFLAGKLGIWIAGSWNLTGLADAKADFTAAPLPTIFKQPVAWSQPHQYTFPKPKNRDEAKRAAAWAHIRWVSDNVADWTLRAGQVSAIKKAHQDPRIVSDPSLKVFLGQASRWQVPQLTTKWVRAETASRPIIEAVYIGQKKASDAMPELARQIDAL